MKWRRVARNVAGSKICTLNFEWETSLEECTWQNCGKGKGLRVNVGTGLNFLKTGPIGGIL
jgi:hypothetical protein